MKAYNLESPHSDLIYMKFSKNLPFNLIVVTFKVVLDLIEKLD